MTELNYYRLWLNDITESYTDVPVNIPYGRTTSELSYYQDWLL